MARPRLGDRVLPDSTLIFTKVGQVVQPAEEMCDIVVVQADLRRGQGHDLFYGITGALGLDVEPPGWSRFRRRRSRSYRELPHRSGKRSTMPPRRANCPGRTTRSARLVAGGGQALEQTREGYPFADCERDSARQIAFR